MNINLLELLREAESHLYLDCDDVSIHEEYSGRGMFGKTTPAISGNFSQMQLAFALMKAAVDLYSDEACMATIVEEVERVAPGRTDELGLGTIYY